MTVALEARELAIGYRRRGQADHCLARGLNLHLRRGQLVGLLGVNGIGKSTLLRTLAGIHEPLAGRTLLAGDDTTGLKARELARRLSMVLSTTPPPSLMTGFALVALGRQPHTDWLGTLRARDRRQVWAALRAVQAEELAAKQVTELSDGQRQKLYIARALAQECQVMLLDEPTAYLDLPRRFEIMALLRQLAHEQARAILVSTHDLDLALRNCDQFWLMSADGITTGVPADLARDGSLSAALGMDGIGFDSQRGGLYIEPAMRPSPASA